MLPTARTTTLGFQNPTANVTYQLQSAAAGTYQICTTTGNCAGVGGGILGAGTVNQLAKFTASGTIGDSSISDTGTTVNIKPTSDSTSTFLVQNAAGTGTVLTVDTTNGRLGINTAPTVAALQVNGTTSIGYVNSVGALSVVNNTGASEFVVDTVNHNTYLNPLANATVGTQTVNSAGLVLDSNYWNGASSITSLFTIKNLASTSGSHETLAIQNNAGATVASFDGSGAALFQNASDSTSAFQIQNAAGTTTLLAADTAGNQINLGTDTNLALQGATAYITNAQGQTRSEAFGNLATAASANGTAIGYNASASADSVAVGQGATSGNSGVAVGSGSSGYISSVAVGESASTTSYYSVAIGESATADEFANAIGFNAAAHNTSIAVGYRAQAPGQNQLVFGSDIDGANIQDAYIGSGIQSATPKNFTLHATAACDSANVDCAGATTNGAGANINIAAGQGTGNANGGDIALQIASPGTSGTSLNSLSTVASFSGANGAALFKNSADSTAAFQIQTATGSNFLTADTLNGTITVKGFTGDSTASALLVTDSSNNNLLQARNDGQVTLGRSSSTNSTFGFTGIGSSSDNGFQHSVSAQRIVTGVVATTLNSITTYVDNADAGPNNHYIVGIYTDSSGAPGSLIASSAQGTLTAGHWNTLPISASLAASTTYWLAFSTDTTNSSINFIPFNAGAGNHAYISGWVTAGSNLPASFGVPTFTSSALDSIYANVTSSGSLATTLTVNPSSGVNVQTPTNTATAFQVQNAAGGSLINVDSTASKVTFGNITSSLGAGLAGNLVLADGSADNFSATLNSSTLTANRNISLPDADGTICLSSGNCTGSGGGVLGSGSNNKIAKFTGAGSIGDSSISDTGSSVTVQPTSNSASAFQVQNSSGASLFNVDSADSQVTAGTSNTTTFGNTFNVSTAPLGGYTSGYYWDGGTGKQAFVAQHFTTAGGGPVTSLSTYVGTNGVSATNKLYQMAIYADNGSNTAPGSYIASTAVGTLNSSAAWNTLPITATLAPRTSYWLVYWTNVNDVGNNGQDYTYPSNRGSANLQIFGTTDNWQCSSGCGASTNGMPNTYPTAGAGLQYAAVASIYATFANNAAGAAARLFG